MVRVYCDKCREDCTDDAITLDAKHSGQWGTESAIIPTRIHLCPSCFCALTGWLCQKQPIN